MTYRCEGKPHNWKNAFGDGTKVCRDCGQIVPPPDAPSPATPDVLAVVERLEAMARADSAMFLTADALVHEQAATLLTALSARVEELERLVQDEAYTDYMKLIEDKHALKARVEELTATLRESCDDMRGHEWELTGSPCPRAAAAESLASQLRQERDAAMDEVSRLAAELAKALAKRWDVIVKEG